MITAALTLALLALPVDAPAADAPAANGPVANGPVANGPAPKGPVTCASKKFTESVLLGEVACALLRSAGAETRHVRDLGGTRVVFAALEKGEVDVYAEYTGTLMREIFASDAPSSLADLDRLLDARGLARTAPLGFNNTYALGMTKARAAELKVRTITDLRNHAELAFGFSNEFLDREDGWPGLKGAYSLPHDARGLDHDLAYRGLQSGTLDVVDLYATDAEIAYYDLAVLDDDRAYFPRYDALYIFRKDLAPALQEKLRSLAGRIPSSEMVALNAAVKLDKRAEAAVAADFLQRALTVTVQTHIETRAERLVRTTLDHLGLVGISLLLAIALAVPLGVIAYRRPRLGRIVLVTVSVLQTVPSLALLVFMIPLLGIGGPPAVAALFIYSLLPIVRNTHHGLTSIPRPLRESAEVLGLSPSARLRLIELPLALPAIIAGIQTAAVINVGTATLGALIGAGGYGQPILTGIRLDDTALILEGAVPAALLALLVQGAFGRLGRAAAPGGLRA